MADSFKVTIDRHHFQAKPDKPETGRITERLKRAGGTELTRAEFCEHVRRGGTWVPGVFGAPIVGDNGKLKWGEFESLQVVAVDIDNTIYEKDSEGKKRKRMLLPGEAGYLTVTNALRLCEIRGLEPMCAYATFSHTDEWPRFRLVFDLGAPITDAGRAEAIIEQIFLVFGKAAVDTSCSNLNRLFFGSNGNVKESWRSWKARGDE